MALTVSFAVERFPIAGIFTIARGSKTEAEVVTCTIADGTDAGRGECVPYRRYGESTDSVLGQLANARAAIGSGEDRVWLQRALPAGAARNAIDCALWDLEAKRTGVPVSGRLGLNTAAPLETAYTLSLAAPEAMAAQAREHAWRPLLKVKLGGEGDADRIRAVREAAPHSRLIIDANEGWTRETVERNLTDAAALGVSLVEQPLPEGQDVVLRDIVRPVPVCADESLHVAGDLDRLVGLYDAVNIKLDKAGGLTEAIELKHRAEALGFRIMVGCMVGTSLAMAPAVLLAQGAEFVDLDGPLLLARDRTPALRYDGSLVSPPTRELWG